jgi:hypothetical protein
MCCSSIAIPTPTAFAPHFARPRAENFAPALNAGERGRYYDEGANLCGIEDHVAALRRAEALLLVYPT